MISDWHVYRKDWHFPDQERSVETIKEAVRGVRQVRMNMNVAPSKKAKVFVVSADSEVREIFEKGKIFFAALSSASDVCICPDRTGIDKDAVSVLVHGAQIYIPLAELVDIEKEISRLRSEKERLIKELERSNKMLGNERFISKAPAAKIEEEKAKLAKYQQMMEQVKERLLALTGK